MKRLNRVNAGVTESLPIKIIQFGEGNFLRAFVDYIIEQLNREEDFNAGVAVVQPLAAGMINILEEQDGLYHLFMKGIKKGEEIQNMELITCIEKTLDPYSDYEAFLELAKEEELKFMVSNTTESGIAYDGEDTLLNCPHVSFPAKVTAFLYERYKFFEGAEDKGLFILPCELIDHNADTLKEMVLRYAALWDLESAFVSWVEINNFFHNTLVDRIVPGYPKDELKAYSESLTLEDKLIVSAEVFFLWVIEGNERLKSNIPLHKVADKVLIVEDLQPYRTRKVRILNGAHTAMLAFSILYGNYTVKETVEDAFTGKFIREVVFDEIIPTLELPEEELMIFAEEVFDRFKNPFIKHQLSSIALNSLSKFRVRVLPSILTFEEKFNRLPLRLTYAFACLIRFYEGTWNERILPVNDDPKLVLEMDIIWKSGVKAKVVDQVLKNTELWGEDLSYVPKLKEQLIHALESMEERGLEAGFEAFRAKF